VFDCAGVCGGNAVLSGCDNMCNSTKVNDCAGVCGGNAVLSGCDNMCNSTKVNDCAGVCGGNAVLSGCDNICNSTKVDLGCGCGEAGPSGCDNMCNSTKVNDCAGICGGPAVADCAGVCKGIAYTDPNFDTDDCTAANGLQACVGGTTGKTACVYDCNNEWGDGSATNYFYYYDNDGDGVAGAGYVNICSTSPGASDLISGKVTCGSDSNHSGVCSDSQRDNISLLDNDNCYCVSNTDCFDDCGVCKGNGAGDVEHIFT
jgi:hypothetical protein